MNLIVCIKQVPDPETPPMGFRVDAAERRVIPPPRDSPGHQSFRGKCYGGDSYSKRCLWCQDYESYHVTIRSRGYPLSHYCNVG